MAQLVVRHLEHAVKVRLQQRARRHGRSMEEEAREILRNTVQKDETPSRGLGSDIAAQQRVVSADLSFFNNTFKGSKRRHWKGIVLRVIFGKDFVDESRFNDAIEIIF